jgi:ABC-type sugar transport system ATPase subunit
MREFIKRLHLELGYTMIYVTHDQEEAMAMADRIVVMHEGVIRQIGTPDEIYQHPMDDFVAGFVGEPPMNFLEGTPQRSNGRWAFRYENQSIPLPDHLQAHGDRLPDQLRMGIRPFYINLSLDASSLHDAVGEVFLAENLCDYNIVSVDMADLRLQVVAPATLNPRRHERIYIKFNPDYVRLFDKTTGKAIRV